MNFLFSNQRTSSATMNVYNNNSGGKRQIVTIVLLLLMSTMMLTGAGARPSLQSLLSQPNDISADVFLDKLLTKVNGDKMYHELKKYHQKQPNYLAKWPGLRDLVFTIDYDDDLTGIQAENNEFLNYKLMERLQQLTSTAENPELYQDVREDTGYETLNAPLKSPKGVASPVTYKEHNAKKNVQYMSPCHFKICNMGRKRDAKSYSDNY